MGESKSRGIELIKRHSSPINAVHLLFQPLNNSIVFVKQWAQEEP